MSFSIITYNFLTTGKKIAITGAFHLPLLAVLSFLRITFAVLHKLYQQTFGKFKEFGESKFGGSEKDIYFLKILK